MFEWLFPGWSNPATVAAVVFGRTLCNCVLTGVVARSVGRGSPLTVVAAALTLGSTVATVLLLRPGWLGYNASFVELGVQVVLLAVVGVAVYADPSAWQVAASVVVAVVAIGLLFVTMILYGEAFVAP